MHRLAEAAFLKVFRKKFIRNYRKHCLKKEGHALLYYKSDPFVLPVLAEGYSHSNYWEILEMARILNRLGFWVDILDRGAQRKDIDALQNKYDLFLGIGAGDSGKYYALIAKKLSRAKKILIALGPEPALSNHLIHRRYAYFRERHPAAQVIERRLIRAVDMNESAQYTDAFLIGGSIFTADTYEKFGKPFYTFHCSSSPAIRTPYSQLAAKNPKKFVYFGGNGNIVKGLDIVIETFSKLPDLELYICAPQWEKDFNSVYQEILNRSPNIHFLGFIKVGGPLFNRITEECAFTVFLSCSEGAANSVVTCMKRGLIPIANYESGIDHLEKFGFLIEDIRVESLREKIRSFSSLPREELDKKSLLAYLQSFEYSQARFSENFEKSIIDILNR